MEYLLKVTAIVTIFYIIYKVFLQRDTFFESNRWFLIIGLISSLVIPFLVIPIYIEYTPVSFDNLLINEKLSTEIAEKPFNILDYLPIIYGIGVVCFFGRFLIQFISLIKIIHKNKGIKKDGFVFIETQSNTSPFSFFKWIVYNTKTFNQTELEHIIEHEKTHAKQYHSIDILITQLFCVLLWFNPFMWLYNKDLKQNLEFIADKRTLNQYNCKKSYQYTLLKTSMPSHQMALSNHFYNSLIKKRIVMLHKSKSKKINLLKYGLVIPIVALFLMGFNTEDVYIQDVNTTNQNPEKSKDLIIIFNKNLTDKDLEKIKSELKKDSIDFTYINLKRNEKEEIVSITAKFKNKKGNGTWDAYNTNNTPIESFYFFKTEDSFGISILDKEIIEIENSQKGDKTPPSKLSEENTIYSDTLFVEYANDSILFNQKKQTIKTSEVISKDVIKLAFELDSIRKYLINKQTINKNSLYIIDGKETKIDGIKKGSKLAKNIESIKILKNDEATKAYGNKGKNGVVEIITKENTKSFEGKPTNKVKVIGFAAKPDSTTTIRIGHKLDVGKDKHPLVIVDGKELSQEEFEKLNPDTVESINVLKDKTVTKKYGNKAKNGVVIITTKK